MIHTPLTVRGGGERQILRLAIELEKLGHRVEIFVNAVDEEVCYPNLLSKVKINILPQPDIPHLLGPMIKIGRSIPKGFDVINNHNFPTEWAAFIAKNRSKTPVVWMCNEPPFWFWFPAEMENHNRINCRRRVYRRLGGVFDKVAVRKIDEIVVLSRFTQDIVRDIYDRQSNIVRSGIDIELFRDASKEVIRKEHNLESDFVLLQVGALGIQGQQTESIKALSYLARKHDNVKLIFDGPGSRDTLIRLSERFGIREKVLFLQSSSDEEIANVYAACDVFVFPSLKTWGLAAVEAMASGKPVITTKKAGVSEIIHNGVNGIIVDNAKEIADQVELLMKNPKLRKEVGENALKNVQNNLSWVKYAKNMEAIFRGVLN
jgi:glycosyltransferase involved in cell wall biosynthesis